MKSRYLFFVIIIFLFSSRILPADIPNWQKVNMPIGGYAGSVVEGKDGALFTLIGNKVYNSTNNGMSWKLNYDSTYLYKLYSTPKGTIFGVSSSWPSIIPVSTDNGESWMEFTFTNSFLSNFAVQDDRIFVYAQGTIYELNLETNDFDLVNTIDFQLTSVYAFLCDGKDGFYLRTDKGFYYSSDLGTSWDTLSPPSNRISILSLDNKGNLIACTDSSKIFKTEDHGKTWSAINTDISDKQITCINAENNGIIALGTNKGIYVSSNEGVTWKFIKDYTNQACINDILYAKTGNFFAATSSGIFSANSTGDVWAEIDEGIYELDITCLLNSSDNDIYLCAYNTGLFRSSDAGISWLKVSPDIISSANQIVESNKGVFVVADYNKLYCSTDKGKTWSVNNKLDSIISYDHAVISLDSTGSIYLYGSYGTKMSYFKSTDNGATWQTGSFQSTSKINFLASGKEVLVCGTNSGTSISSDGGKTWSNLNKTGTNAYFDRTGNLYLNTSSGIIKSTDKGATWSNLSEGFQYTLHRLTDIKFSPNNEIYGISRESAGIGQKNVFKFIEPSAWNIIGYGLNTADSIFIAPGKDYIFASVRSQGFYRVPYSNENKKFTYTLEPKERQVLEWDDSLKFTLNVVDGNQKPLDNVYFSVRNDFNYNNAYLKTKNGKAEYSVYVPLNVKDSIYNISFYILSDECTNSAKEIRTIEIKHQKFMKINLSVTPEDTTELNFDDYDFVVFNMSTTISKDVQAGKANEITVSSTPISSVNINIADKMNNEIHDRMTDKDGTVAYTVNMKEGQPLGVYPVYFVASLSGWQNSDTIVRYIWVSNNTGIGDIHSQGEISINPNPAFDRCILTIKDIGASSATIEVFNLMGEKVLSLVKETEEGINYIPISTGNLAPGMCFVKVVAGGIFYKCKLIIER